ncbi:MAG TPA: M15 family metallopeptidase [Candidatus Nanoarchaeia archaeon]|nr:M15 family metallopeptidase [Candidatus Nanoarchaeia archaeon]
MKFEPDVVSDSTLMEIPVKECGEKLVNARDYSKSIIIDIEPLNKKSQQLKDDECFVRETVAIMLSCAQSILPNNFSIKLVDGFRSMSIQKELYHSVFEEFKNKFPTLSDEELEIKTDKFVANPKIIPPHTTGGAIDLTLVDSNLNELDMGTSVNFLADEAATNHPNISEEAKKNRQILIECLEKVGFVNYPLEWWHWSYGDRTWAFYKKKTFSIYHSL